MSDNNSGKLPPASATVGGVRKGQPRPHPKKDEEHVTPQTHVAESLDPNAEAHVVAHGEAKVAHPSVQQIADQPKSNPSTYHPPQPKINKNANKHVDNGNRRVQQPAQKGFKTGSQ